MKINKFYDKTIAENYIDIYYKAIDSETLRVLNLLNGTKKLSGKNDEKEKLINPFDIAYFEIVDRRCFAYLLSSVFQVNLNLQDILEQFENDGFVRISKSMVVNIYHIKELRSDINMRVNAVLENGETVIINRSYKKEFYRKMASLLKRRDDIEKSNN